MTEVYKTLLGNVNEILGKHHARAVAEGIDFNLLTLLDAPVNETAISKYLAAIFDPNGSHGRGIKALQFFVKTLMDKALMQSGDYTCSENVIGTLAKGVTDDATMRIEPRIGAVDNESSTVTGGRIDIVFYWDNTALIIENKPYAQGQTNQLARYYNSHYKTYDNVIIVYLTKDGRTPDDGTRGNCNPEFIINLSFKELFEALNNYALTLPDNNQYRSSIIQICRHVAQAFNHQTKEFMTQQQEISELLKDKNRFLASKAIVESYYAFVETQCITMCDNIIMEVLQKTNAKLTQSFNPKNWYNSWDGIVFNVDGWKHICFWIGAPYPTKDWIFYIAPIELNPSLWHHQFTKEMKQSNLYSMA